MRDTDHYFIKLVPFRMRHIFRILAIRNQWSSQSKEISKISLLRHFRWFFDFQKDTQNIGRVIVLDDKVIGYIRVEKHSVSIALEEGCQGYGIGTAALDTFLKLSEVQSKRYLFATIYKYNFTSINLFSKFGFTDAFKQGDFITFKKNLR